MFEFPISSGRMAVTQAQVTTMEFDEAGAYAKFGPTGATKPESRYSSLNVFSI